MKITLQKCLVAFAASCASTIACQSVPAAATADELAKAVAEMRNVPTPLVGREAEVRGERLSAAWKTLAAAQEAGARALLDEAARLDATKQKDDRFRLGAGRVVWEIGRFDRIANVLALWGDADFAVKYSYAFEVGLLAARDGDVRALPLLVALLRDQRGAFNVPEHVMELRWPWTHAFLWGPMGRKAVPALEDVLAKTTNPTVASSAIALITRAWGTGALPNLRAIARDPEHGARADAIDALGWFGHPADFEFLCAGLAIDDTAVLCAHIVALYRFGDLRAVPRIQPLAMHVNDEVRMFAIGALGELATVDGLDTFAERVGGLPEPHRRRLGQGPRLLHSLDVTWDAYRKLDRDERAKVLAKALKMPEAPFLPKAGDRKLTREEFEDACKAWIGASRITTEDHEWIEARHVLAVATPADVPLLLDVRGGLFRRVSDECLEEVAILDDILRRLVRSQYRNDPGVCEKVVPPPAKDQRK